MSRRGALIPVLFSVLLASCGGGQDKAPKWRDKAGVQVLRLRWVKPLYPSLPNLLVPELMEEHDRFRPVENGSAGFDTDRRRAFVGASVGGLYCLDLFRGETVWRFKLEDPVGSTPIYDPGSKRVFFGADDGKFYALHARSGRKLWELDTDAEIRQKPILLRDTIYLNNAANTVIALDPSNGAVIWQYRRPGIEGFSSAGYAGLALYGETLITGFSDGYVVALDAISGNVVWQHDLAAEVSTVTADGTVRLVDADATPVVAKEVLVAASIAGGLQGLNPKTGTVLWTLPKITGVTGLAESDGTVYAARSAFGLTAVDPTDGTVLWTWTFQAGVLQDPVVYRDVLVISDSMFGLYVVSAKDGRLLQRVDPRKGFFGRPSMAGGYLLVMGNNGTLYAMTVL